MLFVLGLAIFILVLGYLVEALFFRRLHSSLDLQITKYQYNYLHFLLLLFLLHPIITPDISSKSSQSNPLLRLFFLVQTFRIIRSLRYLLWIFDCILCLQCFFSLLLNFLPFFPLNLFSLSLFFI